MKSFTKEIEALKKTKQPEEEAFRQSTEKELSELRSKIKALDAEIERCTIDNGTKVNFLNPNKYLLEAEELWKKRKSLIRQAELLTADLKDVYGAMREKRCRELEDELSGTMEKIKELQANVAGRVEYLRDNQEYNYLCERLFKVKDELSDVRNSIQPIKVKAAEIRKAMDKSLAEEVLKALGQIEASLKQYQAEDEQIEEILRAAGVPKLPFIPVRTGVPFMVRELLNQDGVIQTMKEAARQ